MSSLSGVNEGGLGRPLKEQERLLRFADRGNIGRLVDNMTPWLDMIRLKFLRNHKLSPYVSVITSGIIPGVDEPTPYAGTGANKQDKYKLEYKEYLTKKKDVTANDADFISEILSRCDRDLQVAVTDDHLFMSYFSANPMNIVEIYKLVLAKAIEDPVHIPALRVKCEAEIRNIKMRRHGETITGYIARFNAINKFGGQYLTMTEIEDSTLRLIFIESLSGIDILKPFYDIEVMKDGVEVAGSLNILQSRLSTWATRMRVTVVGSKPRDQTGARQDASQLGLAAQHYDSARSTKYRGKKNNFHGNRMKTTGPKDQTAEDGRIARNLEVRDSPQRQTSWNQKKPSGQRVAFSGAPSGEKSRNGGSAKIGGQKTYDKKKSLFKSSYNGNENYTSISTDEGNRFERTIDIKNNIGNCRHGGDFVDSCYADTNVPCYSPESSVPWASESMFSNVPYVPSSPCPRTIFGDYEFGDFVDAQDSPEDLFSPTPMEMGSQSQVSLPEIAFNISDAYQTPNQVGSSQSESEGDVFQSEEPPPLIAFGANRNHPPNSLRQPESEGDDFQQSVKKCPKSRVLLDSGSTFHAVNAEVPGGLVVGPSKRCNDGITVQGILGEAKSFDKVTSPLLIGQECVHVNNAPVSVLSLSMLIQLYHAKWSPKGERIRFSSKSLIYIDSFAQSGRVKLEFILLDKLFVLKEVSFDDEVIFSSWCHVWQPPGTSHSWEPPIMESSQLCTIASDKPRRQATESFEASVRYDAEIEEVYYPAVMDTDNLIGYDQPPLVKENFVDVVSKGAPTSLLTKRELARAVEVKQLKSAMRHVSDWQLRNMIRNNRLKGCHLTPKDVDNASMVFGNPDYKGKLTEVKQQIQLSPLEFLNPKQKCEIYCDVMKLSMTSLFLIGVILPFNLLVQCPIVSTSSDHLQTAFVMLLGLIQAYNHELKVVFFDLESGIRALNPFFIERGILLELTNAKTHVSRAERAIRTIKERLRTTIQNAVIKTPKKFLKLLVQSTVQLMNYEVDQGAQDTTGCPAILFGLPPLSYNNMYPWMATGEVPAPVSPVSNSVFRSRTEEALALAPHRSSNGITVWLLRTKRVALRDRFFLKPLTENTLKQMKELETSTEDEMPDLLPFPEITPNNFDEASLQDPVQVRGDDTEPVQVLEDKGHDGGAEENVDGAEGKSEDDNVDHGESGRKAEQATNRKSNGGNTKSYKEPWVDPKNAKFDLHDDWRSDTGKGRMRLEAVEDHVEEPMVRESHKLVDGVRRSTRTHMSPTKLLPGAVYIALSAIEMDDMIKAKKQLAKFNEVNQLIEKGTLQPIMTPEPGTKEFAHVMARLLNLFMIMKEKVNSDGSHDKWKARYVLDGSKQSTDGYEAKTLSSPTPADCIIFLFIAIAAYLCWVIAVIDVTGAFLNSSLLEGSNVYAKIDRAQVKQVLEIRPDWKKFVNDKGDIICKVCKGLYGLRESPLLWSRHLKDTLLKEAGYTQNAKESCVYSRGTGVNMSILIVFVDDILILSKNYDEHKRLKQILTDKYGKITTQIGDKLNYLGMEIKTVDGGFEVTQVGSVEKVLDDYGIVGTKPTPGTSSFTDVFDDSSKMDDAQFNMFRSIVYTLLYIARRTRPDILFQIAWFTSRMNMPTVQDLDKLNHLLKYLNGTRKMGLRLVPRDCSSGFGTMIDASHGLHVTGHGHWGLCCFLFGMCILCISRKHKLVCRSSCESEMLGVNEGGIYILFIRELLDTLGIDMNAPTVIYQDNESAIGIMTGEHKIAMASKHIQLRNLWIMDSIANNVFRLEHLETKLMTADILGKNLVGHLFKRHRYGVMNWAGTKPRDDDESIYSRVEEKALNDKKS